MHYYTIALIGGLGGWELLVLLIFFLLPLGAWIIALVDITRSRFRSDTNRLLWIAIVTLAPVIGVLLYLVLGRRYKLP